jgi:hypothetical protein
MRALQKTRDSFSVVNFGLDSSSSLENVPLGINTSFIPMLLVIVSFGELLLSGED